MKISQYISNITNDFKAYEGDMYLSPKFIYYKSIDIASDFVSKSNGGSRRLYKLQEGWKSIECLEMEEVPVTECCEIDTRICQKLMKSKFPIPNTFTSMFGNVIKYVASNNLGAFYDPTTPRIWKAIQKREYKDKSKKFYWIIDNYIYIPIPVGEEGSPESIRLEGWFIEPWKADLLNAETDEKEICISPLDYEMPIPENLRNDVSRELYNQLRQVYLQIQIDDYPNINQADKQNQRDLNNDR